jgi:uncharacterized paraquat-inducible protein A
MRQGVELTQQPTKPPVQSITGIILQGWQKGVLLVLALGLLYLRVWSRKRTKERLCSHCGQRNPHHQTNCLKCSAPLF